MVDAFGTSATNRSTAGTKSTSCTSTSAPCASWRRLSEGRVSLETTMERSGASNRYANAGFTGGWSTRAARTTTFSSRKTTPGRVSWSLRRAWSRKD